MPIGVATHRKTTTAASAAGWVSANVLAIVFFVLCLLLTVWLPVFATPANVVIILQSCAIIGVMALGLTFVMISGGFDLSFGATMFLAGAVAAQVTLLYPDAAFLAIFAAPLVGAAVGMANGALVVLTGISPLLGTIATALIIRAFAVLYVLETWMEIPRAATSFRALGQGTLFGIPYAVLVLVGLAVLAHWVLIHTVFGRQLYLVGANPRAALVSGLPCSRVKIIAYTVCGSCAGIAGAINVASVGGLSAVFNISYLYEVVTAVVVGGVSFYGGVGTAMGVFLGVLILAVLRNGMVLLNTPHYAQSVVAGVFLLIAIGIDSWLHERRLQK
jgi:ribose/xylose/arabinose/galactoside ABC-type transport system permease subunit